MMKHPKEFLVDVIFGNARVYNMFGDGEDLRMGESDACDCHGHAKRKAYGDRCNPRV
jgi:hypothetical protein